MAPKSWAEQKISEIVFADFFHSLKMAKPDVWKEADFQLECCREVMLWSRELWTTNKVASQALAKAVAMLTLARFCLLGQASQQAVAWKEYHLYTEEEEIMSMQEKLRSRGSISAIERKAEEMRASMLWLADLTTMNSTSKAVWQGAYAILEDTLVQLDHFVLKHQVPLA